MNSTIEHKIQKYIRRLYQYKALENFVIFFLFFLGYLLLYLLVEYFFYLPSLFRTILFYLSVSLSLFWLLFKIFYPLVQSFIPRFQISLEEASKQIGSNNSEINDRLLNLLQLKKKGHDDLVFEGIKQLELNLFKYDFTTSLSLKHLLFFIKLLVIPLALFLIVSIANFDGFIVKPSMRIISYNQKFQKPLDFRITILNNDLSAIEGEDFLLEYKVNSSSNNALFIFIDDNVFEIDNSSKLNSYIFKNVKNSFDFRIGESKTKSYKYHLNLIHPPKVNYLKLQIVPPKYTRLSTKVVTNISDIEVAEGSILKWKIKTDNVDKIIFNSDSTLTKFGNSDDIFSFNYVATKSFDYSLQISNKLLENYISLDYSITTIADANPKIIINRLEKDPTVLGVYSFNLDLSDDYGLTKYGYQIIAKNKVVQHKYFKTSRKSISQTLDIDVRNMDISGDAYIRFFVTDNDNIHGNKTIYSPNFPIHLYTTEKLSSERLIIQDSLFDQFSTKLNNEIKIDSINNNSIDFLKEKQTERKKLNDLKSDIENSLKQKKELLKSLNSISDKELLDEIEKAIEAQQELLKQINEALKDNNLENSKTKKHDELRAKNDFQQKKTLNLLRKIATSQMLKSLINDAKKLDDYIEKLPAKPSLKNHTELEEQQSKLEDKLQKYSNLKGSDDLQKELKPDLDILKKEASAPDSFNKSKMKKSSERILSKLKSQSSSSLSGGESMSVDIELVNSLFNKYLSCSYDEERLITNYDLSSLDDHNRQYNILSRIAFLNSSLYNFAVENENFTRSSFDLIYPLQLYSDKFDDAYEDANPYKINHIQMEMLSDINLVTDLLSDIIEQLNNASANSSSEGNGNDRKQGTPQDLIDQQKQLNSMLNDKKEGSNQEGEEGKSNSQTQLSDQQVSDIIKKQEEIRRKFNELNGGSKTDLDNEVKEFKKSLLANSNRSELSKHQKKILKFLKDFKGEAKKKDKIRKSKSGKQSRSNEYIEDVSKDKINPKTEKIQRVPLDFNDFYKRKLNTIR